MVASVVFVSSPSINARITVIATLAAAALALRSLAADALAARPAVFAVLPLHVLVTTTCFIPAPVLPPVTSRNLTICRSCSSPF